MLNKKTTKIFLFCFIVIICVAKNIFAGEWIDDGGWWQYKDDDGFLCTNTFETIDGKTYYFDDIGHMVTGLVQTDKGYYYYNDDGTPRSDKPIVLSDGVGSLTASVYEVNTKGKVSGVSKKVYENYENNKNEFGSSDVKIRAVDKANKIMNSGIPFSRTELYFLLRCETNKAKDNTGNKKFAEAIIKEGFSQIVLVGGIPNEKFPPFEAEYAVNNCSVDWAKVCEQEAMLYAQKYSLDTVSNILDIGQYTAKEKEPVLNNILDLYGDKAGQGGYFGNHDNETTTQEATRGAAYVPSNIAPEVVPMENNGAIIAGKYNTAGYTEDQQKSINMANEILSIQPCSRVELMALLEAKGLSHQQALDGVEFCGANWHTQAERSGRALVDKGYSISTIGDLLGIAGFEERQIGSGVTAAERYKTQNGIPTTETTQPIEFVTEQEVKNSKSEGSIISQRKTDTSVEENALNEAKKLISEKPYSKLQMEDALLSKGFPKEVAMNIIYSEEIKWGDAAKLQARIWVDEGFSIGEIIGKLENAGYDGKYQDVGLQEARAYIASK